jgi:hypothetical protein
MCGVKEEVKAAMDLILALDDGARGESSGWGRVRVDTEDARSSSVVSALGGSFKGGVRAGWRRRDGAWALSREGEYGPLGRRLRLWLGLRPIAGEAMPSGVLSEWGGG